MLAHALNPILNVSDLRQSFDWFAALGGSVCSGNCAIFLCLDGQGGRGKGPAASTFGPESDENGDRGVWMSIWVDDVDAVHRECLERGLDVTWPPTDMPWNVREMHVRPPDGHVFRISRGLSEVEEGGG